MRFSGTKSDVDYGHSWTTLNLNLTRFIPDQVWF